MNGCFKAKLSFKASLNDYGFMVFYKALMIMALWSFIKP